MFKVKQIYLAFFAFAFIVLISFATGLNAASTVIQEITSIEDILPFVDEHTLVAFDLDNTLIEPDQFIASDQWFDLRLKEYVAVEESFDVALSKFLVTYHQSKDLTQEKLIEPKSAKIIQDFQKKGNLVLAITARGKELYEATTRHLTSVGIDFSYGVLTDISYKFLQGKSSYAYDGLILCAGQHKGRSLVAYLNYLRTHPRLKQKLSGIKKIVYVDDKQKYLAQIEEHLEDLGVESFVGFRYGAADSKVAKAPNDMAIAKVQEEFLGKILTNEAANDIVMARQVRKHRG